MAYLSPGGLQVSQLQDLATKMLGVPLPQAVVDAVHADVADLRLGAGDVGRRNRRYDSFGTPIGVPTPA